MLRLRKPVRREGAERYLFLTLVSFAVTVLATRAFLELTGYPRIGGGELHFAHALWGGLFLFVAALLPIILAGRNVYRASAVLGGVGIGLFIDEVGKFITTSNDYFYPAAAPLIYATFLLAVLVYLRVRRRIQPDPRSLLLTSLQLMEEAVDDDLQDHERDALRERLRNGAAQAPLEEQRRLAVALLAGSLLMALSGRDRIGATLAEYGLLISLALADLASFYLNQFATLELALFHGLLLFGVVAYRRQLPPEASARSAR